MVSVTLGTGGFSLVRREFSVWAEGQHIFGRRPKPEKSLAPRVGICEKSSLSGDYRVIGREHQAVGLVSFTLKHNFWKEPTDLFEKSWGSKCGCLLSDLLQFWVWVGEMRSNMNWSGYIVRPYLLTSNLICQVTGCKRGKLHRPFSFRQPVHCNLEYMYLLTKWFLNSCCHIHKHLYKVA